MRNRRPSPEHEQAVARRLALLAAEWDTAKAVDSKENGARPHGHGAGPDAIVPPGGEWPWNPPTRVSGSHQPEDSPPPVAVEQPIDLAPLVELREEALPEEEPSEEPPPLVRAPGRHAARRGPQLPLGAIATGVSARLGAPLSGVRARLNAAHLTWVAVLVAVALGVTCWWLVAAKESTVLTPVSATFSGSEAETTPQSEKSAGPHTRSQVKGSAGAERDPRPGGAEEVVVDVAGKVRRPGIVVLRAGSRVADAIEAAGGAKRGVDLTSLNLARRLLDGEQILVGKSAATGVGAAPPPGGPSASTGALVNLNSASQTELETLPGVGPVTAAAIVEWRTRHGGFTAVEDLLEVDGIGEVTLKRLAPLVSV